MKPLASAHVDWLQLHEGDAPLLLSLPHTGTRIPDEMADRFVSPWLARRDTDWWVHALYAFAADLGATIVRTDISRSVIDVNRDPCGASLYPGQNTTGLCPLATFDDEALYHQGQAPDDEEIQLRRARYFDPYHRALQAQIARLRGLHPAIVVYDAHSIRSHIPHLFEGELPQFNIGTNLDASCDSRLTDVVERICAASGYSHVRNGRFRGGWITRSSGNPAQGVHAIQMELACRGYMLESQDPTPLDWPSPWEAAYAAPLQAVLRRVLQAALDFARSTP